VNAVEHNKRLVKRLVEIVTAKQLDAISEVARGQIAAEDRRHVRECPFPDMRERAACHDIELQAHRPVDSPDVSRPLTRSQRRAPHPSLRAEAVTLTLAAGIIESGAKEKRVSSAFA